MTNPDQKQVPGIYRRRIGDAMVTVINDGYLDMSFELLRGVPLEDMHVLMREVFHDGPPRITVNAYVVQTGGRTVLVDAGGGSTTVFSMGLLPENLRTAGFSPARRTDAHPPGPFQRSVGDFWRAVVLSGGNRHS